MHQPQLGERVFARPSDPSLRVQRGANLFGQFLPPEGSEVVWDEFLAARLGDGSVCVDPLQSLEVA